MFKKINNIVFLLLFFAVFLIPMLFTRWESGGVSEEENRNLAAFPSAITEGSFNESFTKEFETWFMDHMGLRKKLIDTNKTLMQEVFNRSLTTNAWKTGKTGDSIYATDAIIKDFAHVNLRAEATVEGIGNSYQIVSDYLEENGIPFYYVQCVDKHTIYPERFLDSVKQVGTVSKTDQVLDYLQNKTTVEAIYFKQTLLDNKEQYDVFSHWGDPTHWTYRGAYISYCYMMERIKENAEIPLRILEETDYDISLQVNSGPNGETEQVEIFTVKEPKATMADVSVMGKWGSDQRHSVWKNPEAGNDLRLLLMADSYINSFLICSIAESFSEVWLVWGDYTNDLPEIVELCDPDMVIYECAERVDRSGNICELARKLKN